MKRHYDFLGIKEVTVLSDSSYDKMEEAYDLLDKRCRSADLSGGN
jgi:hypothetical protein